MPPRLSEPEIARLRVLYEESPLSVLALIRETGHSHRTIYYYATRYGWKPRSSRRQPRLSREAIRSLYERTIVPVAEIARLAGVATQTIHAWAARDGWKPRATRLRGHGTPAAAVADVQAELAAALERAADEEDWRDLRAFERETHEFEQMVRSEERDARRAEREREKKAGTYRRVWYSPAELVSRGLPGWARVDEPRPEPPLPPVRSHYRDESE